MRKLLMTVLILALVCGGAAQAQNTQVELIPFGGYRWGGGLNTVAGVRNFDVDNNASFGIAIDARTPHHSAVELNYSHFQADWKATLTSGVKRSGGPLKLDDIMVNGLWYAHTYSQWAPYFTIGLGVAIFSSEGLSATGRFGWNLGGGIRYDASPKIGFRVDGRWLPVWFTTGTGAWCDPFYGCYTAGTGEFFDQFELTGGLIIKLGS